ncbi:MAG: rhamnosidase, partial [Ruminococcus sp.]|nr:rhamnosidase [Ruminococcus sp.]
RNMLREGATACFEVWGKEQKWNTSLCHAWSSSPVSIVTEEIAGFKPRPETENGFEFSPRIPDGIPRFELQVPFRGHIYTIKKYAGETPVLERKDDYAVPQNE